MPVPRPPAKPKLGLTSRVFPSYLLLSGAKWRMYSKLPGPTTDETHRRLATMTRKKTEAGVALAAKKEIFQTLARMRPGRKCFESFRTSWIGVDSFGVSNLPGDILL